MERHATRVPEDRQPVHAGAIQLSRLSGALRAASTEVDITNCGSVSYRNFPLSECELRHRLRAKIILVADEQSEALWISADECSFRRAPADRIKQLIRDATGIDPARVLLAGTHAHSTHHYTSFQADRFAMQVCGTIQGLRRSLRPVRSLVERVGATRPGAIVNRRLSVGAFGELCVIFNDHCVIDRQHARVDASGAFRAFLEALGTTPEREGVPGQGYVLDGPTDNRLHLWTLLDDARRPIASVFRVNAHAVTVSQSRVGAVVSADYVRYLEDEVKASTGGAPCLTLNGAFGDTRPFQSAYTFEEAERIGREWARSALGSPAKAVDVSELIVADAPGVRLPIRQDVPRDAEALRLLARRMAAETPPTDVRACKRHDDRLACLRALLDPEPPAGIGALRAGELEQGFFMSEWQAWRFGPIRLLCLPGEPFVRLSRGMEEATGCLAIGIANGYISYLPDPEAIAKGGYEASESLVDADTLRALPDIARTVAEGLRIPARPDVSDA